MDVFLQNAKAIVAAIVPILAMWGVDLGLEWQNLIVAAISAFAVWLIPNKEPT